MSSNLQILVGADPELFVGEGPNIISAHDLIPGTKLKPFKVDRGAIQVDGVAAEFNIAPALTPMEFVRNIHTVMTALRGHLPGKELLIQPTATFGEEYWATIPNEQKILGCDPDYNAYTGMVNSAPDAHGKPMRTAAGHVHVGFVQGKKIRLPDMDHFEDCRTVVRNLDYTLGLPSLWWDNDSERRTLYGKAGAFRPKKYGVEYRTLSNKWLESELLMVFIHQMTVATTGGLMRGAIKDFSEEYGSFAEDMINSSNTNWHKTPTGIKVLQDLQQISPTLFGVYREEREPRKASGTAANLRWSDAVMTTTQRPSEPRPRA